MYICTYVYIYVCVYLGLVVTETLPFLLLFLYRLPPMHVVLLTGHTRYI